MKRKKKSIKKKLMIFSIVLGIILLIGASYVLYIYEIQRI